MRFLYFPYYYYCTSINSYPASLDDSNEIVDSDVYVYGELKIGPSLTRTVLCFPFANESVAPPVVESADNQQSDISLLAQGDRKFGVDFQTCVLPGLADIDLLKESLSWSTFVLEIHNEQVYERTFHKRNVEEYSKLYALETTAPVAAAPTAPGAKGAKGAAAAAIPPPAAETVFGAMSAADKFLLQIIRRALNVSRQIQPHGTVRFRMDELLSNSNDLLSKYERKRKGGVSGTEEEIDDNIVVQVNNWCIMGVGYTCIVEP